MKLEKIKYYLIFLLTLWMLNTTVAYAQPVEKSKLSFTCYSKCGKRLYFAKHIPDRARPSVSIIRTPKSKYKLEYQFLESDGTSINNTNHYAFSSNPDEAENKISIQTDYTNVRLILQRRSKKMIVDIFNMEPSMTYTTIEKLRFKKGHFRLDAKAFNEEAILKNNRYILHLDMKKATRITD